MAMADLTAPPPPPPPPKKKGSRISKITIEYANAGVQLCYIANHLQEKKVGEGK